VIVLVRRGARIAMGLVLATAAGMAMVASVATEAEPSFADGFTGLVGSFVAVVASGFLLALLFDDLGKHLEGDLEDDD